MKYKLETYNGHPQVVDLNEIFAGIEKIVDAGLQGEKGDDGEDGNNGWSPVLATEGRFDDVVLKVVDWAGGEGIKPSTGMYLSETGFVSDIQLATNIRGIQGEAGIDGVDGNNGADGVDGTNGQDGEDGEGVPTGGLEGQLLAKQSNDDYDTYWIDPPTSNGGGSESFTELDDTPTGYTGSGSKLLAVKASEDGIEFVDAPNAPNIIDTFTGLTDTPTGYSNQAGKMLVVNAGETALEFAEVPEGGGGGVSTLYGTFTPNIYTTMFASNGQEASIAWFDQQARWTRTGNWVTVHYRLRWTSTSSEVDLYVRLPFLPDNAIYGTMPCANGKVSVDGVTPLARWDSSNHESSHVMPFIQGNRAGGGLRNELGKVITTRVGGDTNAGLLLTYEYYTATGSTLQV